MLRIRYSSGAVKQGILLALGDQKIRVALKGADDVMEYRLLSQRWVSEDCEIATIEFGEEGAPFAEAFPKGLMAGGLDRPVAPHIM